MRVKPTAEEQYARAWNQTIWLCLLRFDRRLNPGRNEVGARHARQYPCRPLQLIALPQYRYSNQRRSTRQIPP